MTAAASRRRSEAGTTLIELIVTVAIMGFAMLAIMGGIGTSIIFADIQRKEATAGLVLTSAAEKVVPDAGDYKYEPCAADAQYPNPPSTSSGFTVSVAAFPTGPKVKFWDVSTNRFVDRADSTCAAGVPVDSGLQLIRLSVSSTRHVNGVDTLQVQTLDVVKRRVES